MKRLQFLFLALVTGAAVASCGGNDIECGPGTTNQDGTCVADTTSCGAGTVAMGDECVPDGSMICEQGTVFNPATSHCDLDPSACADGTALVNGQCVPEDDHGAADLEEAAEPNDSTGAGQFDAPAVGSSVTIHGCVTPRSGAADSDPWIITATGPTLLEITDDGVHGLAAGFAVINQDNPKLATWQRLGVNLTGDTSKRQVFLPAAGDYILLMDDSRAMILGAAAGGPDTCYFGTITGVAMPAATPITLPQTTGEDSGDVKVLSFDATATGDIFDVTENSTSSSMLPGFVVMRNGALEAVAATNQQTGLAPFYTAGGLEPTNDQIELVVDNEFNYGVTPQAYALDAFHIASQALPTAGTDATVTEHNGDNPTAPWWDQNYLYFDVAQAGQIVHFDLTSSTDVTMMILRRDIYTPDGNLDVVADIDGSGTDAFQGEFVRFLEPGRYYFVTLDPSGTTGTTYTITSTLTNMTVTPVTYGTQMTGQALTPQGSTFYSYAPQATDHWAKFAIPAADWGGDEAHVSIYDLSKGGWLDDGYDALEDNFQVTDGSSPLGRIVIGDTHQYLVRVEDDGVPSGAETFTLDASERAYVDLGTITAGTPIDRTGMDSIPADGDVRYLVQATANDLLTLTVTPDAASDISIDALDRAENSTATADSGLEGEAETLHTAFPSTAPYWVAFTIHNFSDAASASNVSLSSVANPFTSICDATTTLPGPFDGSADDDFSAVQTLPAGFTFYGQPVSNFIIGSNGFLTFGATAPDCSTSACWSNGSIPSTDPPTNLVAAYWDDLQGIQVCRKDDAANHTVTIEWSGHRFDDPTAVEFQAVLHQDGSVDFVYGGNQAADGASATVGVENADGTVATQLVYDTSGSIAPGTTLSATTP